jgi:hypothetical protein
MKHPRLPNKTTFDQAKYSKTQMREYGKLCMEFQKEKDARACEALPSFRVGQIRADFATAIRNQTK